ncbi:MAG: 50S ribosomal protein L18 [Halobacteriota archaeon]|nr:50S ribosomal protein L18 [Halobacteriota archaeon]
MARGPNYRVPFRRRREGKTNYRRRIKLLVSNKPRLVIRKSNKHISLQLAIPKNEGDETLLTVRSTDLAKYGYKGNTGNIPAAYLTGLLFGMKAVSDGYKEAILDIGLQTSTPGSRIYAALKGAIDGGIVAPCDESVLPNEERIKGDHTSIADLPDHFDSVKGKILDVFGV